MPAKRRDWALQATKEQGEDKHLRGLGVESVFVSGCVCLLLVMLVVEIKKKKNINQGASTQPEERQTAPEICWPAIRGVVGLLH